MPEVDDDAAAIASITKMVASKEHAVVAISGELDISNVDGLRAQFETILELAPQTLVIDVRELKFMDSSGIALFVQLAIRTGALSIRNPSPLIRRVLEATGVAELLGVEK